MKKTVLTTLALTALLVCLTGCGKQGPTPKPDDSVRGAVQVNIPDDPVTALPDDDPAAAGTPDAQPAAEDPDAYAQPVPSVVSGSFTATVRKLIPDYVSDAETPRAAVVTLFQDGPFVIQLDEHLCTKLQEDKTYTFIVGKQDAELCQWEYTNGGFVQQIALIEQKIRVTDVREATEDEYGLECWRVECGPKT
ncbi:MAG: hypothetical protein IKG82_14180 [Oscillospiraceae bacterium]|nr:hypothetical protein [Oscillospiraceae bacterium]